MDGGFHGISNEEWVALTRQSQVNVVAKQKDIKVSMRSNGKDNPTHGNRDKSELTSGGM